MSTQRMGEALASIAHLLSIAGTNRVTECDVCKRPSDRLLCHDCREKREKRHAEQFAEFDLDFRAIVRRAKELGQLQEADKAWLLRHGCKDTVEGLEARFKRDADRRGAPSGTRRKDKGAGF